MEPLTTLFYLIEELLSIRSSFLSIHAHHEWPQMINPLPLNHKSNEKRFLSIMSIALGILNRDPNGRSFFGYINLFRFNANEEFVKYN